MKHFIVSAICLLILIIPWGLYDRFSDASVKDFDQKATAGILQTAEAGNWKQTEENFDMIARDWNRFKRISSFFTATESLNEIDSRMARISSYIRCRDAVSIAAEINELTEIMNQLHENETLTLENIF